MNNKKLIMLVSAIILVPLSLYSYFENTTYYTVQFDENKMHNMETDGIQVRPDGSGLRALVFTDVVYDGHITFTSNTCQNIFSVIPDDDLNEYIGQHPIINIQTACDSEKTIIGGRNIEHKEFDITHDNTIQYTFKFDNGRASLLINDNLIYSDLHSYYYRASAETTGTVTIADSRK